MALHSMDYLLRPLEDDCEDYSSEGPDWIDEALAKGFGFKNEEEKKAYLDSLGDPLEHPLFAESAEDMKNHPLYGAFRAINEEDKTNSELALMYKDEGNQWLKKATKKDIYEAKNCYSHALGFIDKAIEFQSENEMSLYELKLLKSQVFSNRSQASLNLKNYGECIRDSNYAIDLNPSNLKAYFRKSKSLFHLKRFSECIKECDTLLSFDFENKETLALKDKCSKEITKLQKVQENINQIQAKIEFVWKEAWRICTEKGIRLGYSSVDVLSVLPKLEPFTSLPNYDKERQCELFPVVFSYPQYNQVEIIQGVAGEDMLVEHLANMFPEKDEGPPIAWDLYDEFHVSNLVIYHPVNSMPVVPDYDHWVGFCRELSDMKGARGVEAYEKAKAKCMNRTSNFKKRKDAIENTYDYSEVHIGCSFYNILNAKDHILSAGIIHLLIFVRGNKAHKKFLKENKIQFNTILLPT